ncbi:carboxypeptidase-like regulatory domain-containing protein [Longimicrobium terrae]|uniref:Carboxypeptidase regulatory-like domain-containing protein n=1 Tax=Longimicrobium terrae TaxID=1639882 RepID=A0A841GWB8_9BACT|nr:carboxypeptidase-like regulatory domain-containing protein [Longimicrobium terrae]MBB4634991.1 hypothetical protein [Longimicrobium terrae]MBB6069385.1 hypothetical protein [Longimicrobium terrae]NNC31809.1 hypothetical protein [Longimicrobium terrae]
MRRTVLLSAALLTACARPAADPAPAPSIASVPRTIRGPKTATVTDTVAVPVVVSSIKSGERDPELATLVGRITDAETGEAVRASIITDNEYEFGDEGGEYRMEYVVPGVSEVTVEMAGYRPQVRTVTLAAGRVDTLNVALRRAAPVRLTLTGTWQVRFKIREPGARRSPPAQRFVEGTLTFNDTLNLVDPERPPERDRYVWTTEGLSEIDFTPFFGSRVASDVSTTVFGSRGGTFEREVVGTVMDGDSVEIGLIPRISHGGVSLSGRARGDSIVGQWVQRAYCCGAHGDFVLRRVR